MPSAQYPAWFAPYLRTAEHCWQILSSVLFSPGSTFSIFSLAFALVVAAAFLAFRGRRHSPRVLWRALFPRWFWRHDSMRADIGFFFLNSLATASLIGWGLFSGSIISHATARMLDSAFGNGPLLSLSPFWSGALMTLALFIAYDFSYWVDHYLKHKVPVLWEFHRVHHTAEVLSPLTNFRMHPVDSLIFANIVGVALGVTSGVGAHVLGGAAHAALLSGNNIILVLFVFATVHLQHSHVPIRFHGWLGKLLFSPAHHHIHHSTKAEHFDSNLGSCLAVWDWMFGTLILPDAIKGKLSFGVDVEGDRYTPHTIAGSLVWPFVRAARRLMPRRSATTSTDEVYDALG